MSIGSTIKQLRRERDITQEQLAEYLGITSRAVSQWECEKTAPDLSQLPALCHIFDVTADALLGIDIEKNNEEIQKYLEEAQCLGNSGQGEKRTALLREANKKFPRDHQIMMNLANSLVCEYSRKGVKEYDEVFSLCNRILGESTDNHLRYETMDLLVTAYGYAGKKDEILKLAAELPRLGSCYEQAMVYRWEGDKGMRERQEFMADLIGLILQMISVSVGQRRDNKEFFYPLEDRIKLWKTEVALLELLFPDGDYCNFAQDAESACDFLCSVYLTKKDYEEAWHWILKGAEFAIHMDTYDFDAPHTSPVLKGYSDGGWIMEACGNHTQSMLDWLTTNDEAAVLRNDPRYDELIGRLKKTAKKH